MRGTPLAVHIDLDTVHVERLVIAAVLGAHAAVGGVVLKHVGHVVGIDEGVVD